jgi:hypothetical protein
LERLAARREECQAKHGNNGFGLTLGQLAPLVFSGWPTAIANDATGSTHCYGRTMEDGSRERRLKLPGAAQMTGWSTPLATDGGKADATLPVVMRRAEQGRQISTAMEARMTGWPTTRATDGDKGVRSEDGAIREAMRTAGPDLPTVAAITGPMRLTRAGELLTGLAAGMSDGGRLNPDHSRWLMGYPAAWGSCGATAMQSSRKPPRSSSKRR